MEDFIKVIVLKNEVKIPIIIHSNQIVSIEPIKNKEEFIITLTAQLDGNSVVIYCLENYLDFLTRLFGEGHQILTRLMI